MAWTTPRTWTTGELVTAALLNTHLRDNLNETAPAKVTALGQLVYGQGANAIQVTNNWRLYEAVVAAPTTVGNYVELFSVPPEAYVICHLRGANGLRKSYAFTAYTPSGTVDIPPYAGRDPNVTTDTVVLESVYDSAAGQVVIRLRRQAGTTTHNVAIVALVSPSYAARSGTGTSANDNPLHLQAQRGFSLVGRAKPSANVTSVSFNGTFRVTRAAGGELLLRAHIANPVNAVVGYHLRVNGEADSSAWTTQHFNIDGTATNASRLTSNSQMFGADALNGFTIAECWVGFSPVDLGFVSVGAWRGGTPIGLIYVGWRSGNPTEVTRVDVVANQTGSIGAGSVIELYALLER